MNSEMNKHGKPRPKIYNNSMNNTSDHLKYSKNIFQMNPSHDNHITNLFYYKA